MSRQMLDKMELKMEEGGALMFRFEGEWAHLALLGCQSWSDGGKNKRYKAAVTVLERLLIVAPDLLRGLRHAQVCDYDEEIRFRCEDCQKIENTLKILQGTEVHDA